MHVVFVSCECVRHECMPIWQSVAQGEREDMRGKGDWRTQREEVCAPADGRRAREQTRAPHGVRARVRSRAGLQGPLFSLIAPAVLHFARWKRFPKLHTQVHISVSKISLTGLPHFAHQPKSAH